ncbi:MAG: glycerol-3-phosphate responsive antiterminator [Bacillota bacterium]|nr:glycerol-3-phosphate responsive antiterminator [Bacillota bacterium]
MSETTKWKFENNYIFPVVYDLKDIDKLLGSQFKVIILGRVLNILNIKRIVNILKVGDKKVLVDIDFIGGLSNDKYAMDFISKEAQVDGIITTHSDKIIRAKRENLISILKIFAYDEFSIVSAGKVVNLCNPDIIETLPGIAAPCFINKLREYTDIPIDVSGYLGRKLSDINLLYACGVTAIHTGNHKLWNIECRSDVPPTFLRK